MPQRPQPPTPPRPVLDVVAAVIEDAGLVLACRRRPEKSAGGKWEFPGGKIEPGESPADALVREIREELGTEILPGRQLRIDDTIVGDVTIRLTCIRAALAAERPVSSTDHDRLRWVVPRDLPSLDWAAPDLPTVRQLAGL